MAHNRLARVALVWTFVPGLALCIACARVLRYITPAIGAVPLLFSSAFSLFLLSNESHTAASGRPTHAHDDDGGESHLRPGPDEVEEEEGLEARHPVLVFFADMILATALFAVLFDSWTGWAPHAAGTPGAMLVAYTTMPLLINFSIHLWLGLSEFVVGMGIAAGVSHLRYHGIPADCPRCGNSIRPSTQLTAPWFRSVSVPRLSSIRQVSFGAPAVPAFKVPGFLTQARDATREWKTPAWAKGRWSGEQAPLLVGAGEAESSHEAYADDYDEDAAAVRPSLDVAPEPQQRTVVEEVVVTRKDKGKSTDSLV